MPHYAVQGLSRLLLVLSVLIPPYVSKVRPNQHALLLCTNLCSGMLSMRAPKRCPTHSLIPVMFFVALGSLNSLRRQKNPNRPSPDADPEDSAVFSEKRTPVRVFEFQRPPHDHVLWTARGEDLQQVMTRARILLQPLDGSLELFLVDPQPVAQPVAIILAPVWWKAVSMNVCLILGI